MRWWNVFIYLLVLYQPISAQPITSENENVRGTRQLDFGECCPCPDTSKNSFDEEKSTTIGRNAFSGTQTLDDCPCRSRDGEIEAASSIFFPSTMRAVESLVRPTKKEDLKPLLHPEVDLASSVLETLREATNQEYQEALARDAVRDALNIADLTDTSYRDATPEESKSMVTVIVSPKDFVEDFTPQESHIQESCCIHAPLASTISSSGKLKAASTPPNLVKEIFGLPKARPIGLLHRNLMDIDSNVGASNIQENIVNFNKEAKRSRNERLRALVPLLELNPLGKSTSGISNKDDCNITSNDLSVSPTNIEEKVLKTSNANINEFSNLRAKPTLEQMLRKTKLLSLRNLLKLRDVELFSPSIFNEPMTVVQPPLLSQFKSNNKNLDQNIDEEISPKEDCPNETKENAFEDIQMSKTKPMISKTDVFDTLPSSSQTVKYIDIGQICDYCNSYQYSSTSESSLSVNTDSGDSTIIDSNIITDNKNKCSSEDSFDPDSNTNETKNANTQTVFPIVDSVELTKSTPNIESYVSDGNCETNDDHCSRYMNNDKNSESYSSANVDDEDNVESNKIYNMMSVEESCISESLNNVENTDVETTTAAFRLLKPLPVNNNLHLITEKIKSKLENLKKNKSDIYVSSKKHPNEMDDGDDNKPPSDEKIELSRIDCDGDNTEQWITTLKPNDGVKQSNNNINSVSIQDLQKISDSMLQGEEITNKTKTVESGDNIKLSDDFNTENMKEANKNQYEDNDFETFTDLDVTLPKENGNNPDEVNICPINIPKSTSFDSTSRQYDVTKTTDTDNTPEMNAGASDIIISKIPQNVKTLGIRNSKLSSIIDNIGQRSLLNKESPNLFKTSLPDFRDILKSDNMPTLNDIQLKLPNLIKPIEKNTQEDPTLEDCTHDISSELKSPMTMDATTSNFPTTRLPLILLERENLDLDTFHLRPLTMPLSKLHPAIKTAQIPLSEKLTLKPINMQSSREDKANILGASSNIMANKIHASNLNSFNNGITRKVSDVLGNVAENFVDLRDSMKFNTQELLNKPSVIDHLSDKLDLSDIKYHAENSLKNIQQKLKAAGNNLNSINPIQNSHNLLASIAEKHDDLSDKLRAVHMDFTDRLETMRNNFINPTLMSNDDRKLNKKIFSNINNNRHSLLKEQFPSKTKAFLRPDAQRQIKPIKSQATDLRIFKMPSAASVPMPKTIETPKLKATSTKTNTPPLLNTPNFKSIARGTEATPVRTSTIFATHAIKNIQNANRGVGGKEASPFRNSKVTVSFSTTPRPILRLTPKSRLSISPVSRLKSIREESSVSDNNKKKDRPTLKLVDSDGALNQIKSSKILLPETNNNKAGSRNSDRQRDVIVDDIKTKPISKNKPLQSWPKTTESSFIDKVKGAVNATLPKTSLAKRLDDIVKSSLRQPSNTDMLRAASDNLEINNKEPLEENVSYRCRMVCTKE